MATIPTFSFHRYANNGFASPAAGAEFEELKSAPQPDQYHAENVAAEKGMVLFNHIVGNNAEDNRYAKMLIEDVTETPPDGVQKIETMLAPTRFKKRAGAPAPEGPSRGTVVATVELEDGAEAAVDLKLVNTERATLKTWHSDKPGEIGAVLPALDNDRYALIASAKGYAPARQELRVADAGIEPMQPGIQAVSPAVRGLAVGDQH